MTSTATPVLTDFPDRLSPMVVKELRQGLRTRAFTSTLLVMHTLLIIATLITGSAQNTDDTRWIFDGLSTIVLCFVMPFRVANALSEEVKLNTLDMLFLTRLSCGRIVFGKWASVALQSLLITLSLMPYVVARYMFGGLELTTELLLLAARWLGGCVVCAILVALSTIRQAWLRMILIFIPLFFFGFGMFGWMFAMTMGRALSSGGGGTGMTITIQAAASLGVVASSAWVIFAFLSLAATRISSQAEPLAPLKRAVHITAFFLPVIFSLITGQKVLLTLCFPVLAVLTLDALTETLNDVPSAYVSFYRRGLLGRLTIGLFSPGWNSGFWLTVLLAAVIAGSMVLTGGGSEMPYFVLAACSVWMVSAIIQVLPTRHSHDLLPIFLGVFALLYLITGMFTGLGVMVAASGGTKPWLLTVLPPAAIMGAQTLPTGPERAQFLNIAMLCGSFWPLLHAFLSLHAWRKLRPVREAARRIAAESATTASHA